MKIGLKAGYDYVAPVVNPCKINKGGEVTRLIMSALADIDEHSAVMNMFSEWWARKMVDIHESASTGKALGWVVKTIVEHQIKKAPLDRLAWYDKQKSLMEQAHLQECQRVAVFMEAVAAAAKKSVLKTSKAKSKLGSV